MNLMIFKDNIYNFIYLGPVVQKLINESLINSLRWSLFLYSQMPFNADIQQKFTIEEVNLEKQK